MHFDCNVEDELYFSCVKGGDGRGGERGEGEGYKEVGKAEKEKYWMKDSKNLFFDT